MTRLITEWLTPIENGMNEWDEKLLRLTGYGLGGLAARAAGAEENIAAGKRAAVVSITSGEGVIGSFAESIAAILQTIGMEVLVTEQTDVSGIYEAVCEDADVVFMADDDRYIALNLRNGRVGENDFCTAMGYLQLLEDYNLKETGGALKGQPVLLMGYGRVGRIMHMLLMEKGALVTVYDKDPAKQEELESLGIPQIKSPEEISAYRLIVDLTNEGDWLEPEWLQEDLIMAAPGVPLSLKAEVAPAFADRSAGFGPGCKKRHPPVPAREGGCFYYRVRIPD